MTAVNLEGVGFKQTEIGCIPSDWHVVSLGSVASKITDGTHDTPKQMKEGIPFLTAIHVKENRIDFDSCYFVSEEVHKEIFRRCNPESGDILMVNIGAGTATTAVVNVPYEFSLKNVALIKPDINNNGRYINYALQFTRNKTLESLATGGAQPFLSLSQIARLIIARPTKLEQTAIANALSDVDALIQELEKLIAKKQAIKTATMQQLLTGRTRLPQFAHHPDGRKKGYKPSELGEIPEDWEVVRLGDVGETIIGLTYSPNDVAEFGTLVLRSSNVQQGKLAYSDCVYVNMPLPDRVIVREGDILVCVRNGSRQLIGKCALIDKKAEGHAFGAFMSIYRTQYSKFVFYQFQSDLIQSQINEMMGATINQITNKDMASFLIGLPCDAKEQTAIAQICSDIDEEIQSLEQRLNKTCQIKQGMMQELLTGKTRLVKPAGVA
ncbi:restriction endonuclease subunit S [Vibrio cholerae]|uniref:restriction endonuclease subunit S n=1 Tax=Vibrio cholerae TaxID=666 RepID=UPI000BA92706|nr:restriction endonuclease subunit S [Vibrio cholerae]PAS28987.1 restriction endonuclease [Vibrio cholerae]